MGAGGEGIGKEGLGWTPVSTFGYYVSLRNLLYFSEPQFLLLKMEVLLAILWHYCKVYLRHAVWRIPEQLAHSWSPTNGSLTPTAPAVESPKVPLPCWKSPSGKMKATSESLEHQASSCSPFPDHPTLLECTVHWVPQRSASTAGTSRTLISQAPPCPHHVS